MKRLNLPAILKRGRTARLASVSALLLISAQHGDASHYYVATIGKDSNAGSASLPWATVQKAANTMVGGDTVTVADGTYPEIVKTHAAGTASQPVTFQANSTNSVVYGFTISNPYQVVRGFTLTGQTLTPYLATVKVGSGGDFAVVDGIFFNSSPASVYGVNVYGNPVVTNVTISNCSFINLNYHAVSLGCGSAHLVTSNTFTSPNGWDAIDLTCSNTTISRNKFLNWSNLINNSNHPDLVQGFCNTGTTQLSQNNVIEGNFAQDCTKVQIGNIGSQILNGLSNWVWRNNIYVNVEGGMSMSAQNMAFYNNVFYKSGFNTVGPILFRNTDHGANNGCAFNNIFYQCGNDPTNAKIGWYEVDSGVTGFQADNNLVIGRGAGTVKSNFQQAGLESHGINGVDPLFTGAAAGQLTVGAESPVIGVGKSFNGIFTTDFAGVIRGTRWDIGAYQKYVAPRAPGNLRVVGKP